MGRLSNYFQGSRSLALDFGDQGDQESSDFSILLLCSGTVCLQKKQRLKDNFHGGSIYDIYVTTGLPLCPLSPLSHAMHYGKDKSHGKGILAILKMAAEIGINELSEVNEPAREPTTIVPVTAAIYHNGQEKPTERWSFELGLILSEDKLLSSMLKRLEKGYGVKDKASALGILKFKIQLSVKDFTPKLPEWPKGRVFAIDCQEQWDNCLPKVLGLQRELIAPKSFYPHIFTSTDYKDLPKLRPPKSRKLSARQVNEMRNWRAIYGQSVPQKTVRNMTTKDNPGTLPINLYAADSPPVEPLNFSALSQAPAVATPQRNRPETLYEQGQIVCVRGNSNALFVIASLQEDTLVGAKRARAKVYNQDPFNAIIFTEDTEKYVEVSNIVCVISNCKSSNGTLELEEGDLILLLEQLQSTNELVTVTEAADLSAETASTDELQSEQPRTRSSRGRKRRFEEDFLYYE